MPPGQSSGLAAFGLQLTVCGLGGDGGGGAGGGLGPGLGLLGHGQAVLPHRGHLMPPGQSSGFFAFGSHMTGPPIAMARIARRLSCSAPCSTISHSTLVRLPLVPHGGTVVTVRCVMATLYHFLAFATSATVKLPSSDQSVPLEITVDAPRVHLVVAGRPGTGPVGTAGGGPGAADTPTTLHFHLNG